MTVRKLIRLLKKEHQGAEVIAYLGAKDGGEMVKLGYGDAILGKQKTNEGDFVLIPIEVPDKLQPWAEE